MTVWRPQMFPFMEIHYGLTMQSSGQKSVETKFGRKIYAAFPVAANVSSYGAAECNGFTVVNSAPYVHVFVNCSGNDDSASGVLPNLGTLKFDLRVYGQM